MFARSIAKLFCIVEMNISQGRIKCVCEDTALSVKRVAITMIALTEPVGLLGNLITESVSPLLLYNTKQRESDRGESNKNDSKGRVIN